MVDLQALFDEFKREKRYLNNVTPATVRSYEKSWLAFVKHHGSTMPDEASVKQFMVSMLASGLKPGAANSYARSVNSFLSWLHDAGHTTAHFRVQMAKDGRKVLKTYSAEDVARIVAHRPATATGKRVMAVLYLLIDTGCRVNEALTLTRGNVDFDNLLVTLRGKGGKERRVPICIELRKVLFRWLGSHPHSLVFCTRDGKPLSYDNLKRDFLAVLRAVKVEKTEGSFHAFRRFFGKSYLRNGGNALYLKRLFGHSTLAMVQRYVDAEDEDLRDAHRTLSPLEGLKRR